MVQKVYHPTHIRSNISDFATAKLDFGIGGTVCHKHPRMSGPQCQTTAAPVQLTLFKLNKRVQVGSDLHCAVSFQEGLVSPIARKKIRHMHGPCEQVEIFCVFRPTHSRLLELAFQEEPPVSQHRVMLWQSTPSSARPPKPPAAPSR